MNSSKSNFQGPIVTISISADGEYRYDYGTSSITFRIDYDSNGRAVVIGGHVNMTVDDGSDAQSALAARLGPGPHGYNEDAATGQGQGSEFSRLGTSPSVHLDGGLLHVDRFNASAWGGLGVVPHFFYDVMYGHMQGSSNPMLPY